MKQKLSLMMTALLLSIGMSLWGQECTTTSIDLSEKGYENQQDLNGIPISVNHDVTLTFYKGAGSNSPKYYTSGTAVRCYGGNYFTVGTSSGYINSITLTFGSGDGSNPITTDVGTFESPTWTGEAATVNFTIDGTTGHRRIKALEIMYCTGGTPQETVATPTFNPATGTYYETQSVTITCATDGATMRYTIDGTDPTESSSVYSNPLTISTTTTVKAKAWKEGCNPSAVASATYTIESNPLVFNKVENHAVEAGNTYLIVDVYSGKALTSANGTSSAPTAVPVTISNNQIVTGNSQLQWTFEATEGGYIIHPANDETKWLYCINNNNGARVGTGSNNIWTLNIIDENKPNYHGFYNNDQERYLGVFNNQDWRTYTTINNNIQNTQIELFVLGDAPQPTPTLTVTPNSLSDLDYVYGNGPSEPQTFTVSGTSLTGNVAINAPENFGICFTASGTYTSSLLLVPNAGTLSATTLYVHLNAGLNAGDYSGNVTAINGEVNATVALSGTVTSMPVVETPTLSPASGTYLEAQTVTIACATEGATIRYTTDGTAPTENSTVYTEALNISTTTTVKAKAWKEGCEASGIAEATYTFPVLITIAEARALEANEYALVQGIVTFIDGRNIYIQDATAGIDLFLNNNTVPSDLALGDLVKVYGKRGVYQGLVELTDINGNDNSVFSILSTGNNLPMTVKTIAEILADHTSGGDQLQATRVKIEGATLGTVNTSGNTPLTQGENSINIYKIPALTGIGEDDIVDVTAVVGCHSNNAQLLVATVEDVVLISHPQSELTVTPTTLTGFSYMFGSGPSETQNFTVSGIHLYENVSVTAPEGFEVSLTAEGIFAGSLAITPTESTLAETTIYIRMATGLSVGDHSGDLTVVCGSASSTVALSGTVNALPVVATPTFSPDGGTYTEAQSVTIACATEGATIRYTTDGTNPTESSTVYTETLTISETTTVKAIAMKDGYQASDIAEATYIINIPEPVLTVAPTALEGFTYTFGSGPSETQTLTVLGSNLTANVVVTAPDGFEVCLGVEGIYLGSLTLEPEEGTLTSTNVYVRMMAGLALGDHSGDLTVASGTLSSTVALNGTVSPMPIAATPTFTPESGIYNEAQTVTISCTTEGAIIRYTTDGTNPTESSTVYTETLTISETTTIKAIAMKDGYQVSAVAEATYTINIPEPVLTVAPTALEGFTYTFGNGPSEAQSLTASGSNLTANVVVTAPEGFEICLAAEGIYLGSLTLEPEVGTLTATNVYVRMMAGLALGDHSGDLTVACGELSETVALSGTVSPMPVAATPTFSPDGGTYNEAQTVTISCTTEGAIIRYTTDGTNPTESSTVYTETLTISETTTIKAIAMKDGYQVSAVAEATYTINIPEPVLTVAPTALEGFTYTFGNGPSEAQSLTASGSNLTANVVVTAPEGFEICLAAEGIYLGSLTLEPEVGTLTATNVYVRMMAGLALGDHSGDLTVVSGDLSETVSLSGTVTAMPIVATPTFSPEEGTFTEAQTVAISCTTEGATIHYTLDGSDPTVNSLVYSSPLAITETTTVKAFAMKDGYQASAIVTATYTINIPVPVEDYVRINNVGNLVAGNKVILAARYDDTQSNYMAMPNTASGKPDGVQFVSIVNDGNETVPSDITNNENSYYWTVGITDNGFTFTNANGVMIGYGSSGTDFVSGGDNTEWSVVMETAPSTALVPDHTGFVISNVNNSSRAFAMNNNHKFGAYALSNMTNNNAGNYNFVMDIFMQGEPGTPIAATPTFSPAEGTYTGAQSVTIACATENATIHYTLDGTDPTENSAVYAEALTISETTTVKAKAWKDGYDPSAIAEATYTINIPEPVLTVSPTALDGFAYTFGSGPSEAQSLTVSGSNLTANVVVTAPEGFEVCLSAEGIYDGSITLTPNEGTLAATDVHVRMMAGLSVGDHSGNLTVGSGDLSETVSLNGTVTAMPIVATPAFSPEEGTFTEAQTVAISCSTEGATIHYTLDGSDPTVNSLVYSSPLAITETTTVKAFAVKDGYQASAIASAVYTIEIAPSVITIAEARALALDEYALVQGIVTFIDGKNVYIQDETAGIDLFLTANAPSTLALGDTVQAYGKRAVYKGLVELTNINPNEAEQFSIVSTGNELPMAIKTIAEILADFNGNNMLQSTRVKIESATIGAINPNNNTLLTQNGSSINIYKVPALTSIVEGDIVDVTAVIGCFNDPQLRVALASDVVLISQPDPVLTVSATDLSGFSYSFGDGPSEAQSFTVSGTNLTADVTVTAPEGFEVCLSADGTFVGNLTLIPEEGTLAATTVYVRMAEGLEVGDHFGDLAVASGDLNETIALSGTVSALPIVAAPTFSPDGGTYTEAQTVTISCETEGATIHYTLDGTDPTVNSEVYVSALTIAESTTVKAFAVKDGYQASAIISATYIIEESLTFNKVSNHAVAEGSVYLIVDMNSGTALTSANGTSSAPIAVPITISNNQIVTGNSQLQWTFEATESGYIIHPANDETKWLYSTNSNNGVRIGTNPDNVWVLNITDTDHPDYHGFQHFATSRYLGVYNNQDWRTYTTIHDNIKETQIELFILGDAPQPEPELTVSPTTLSSFSYIYGAGPSETQSITVSGSDLTANVTLTTPESFEIGLSAEGNFTDNISLTPEEGALTATVYVRMAAGLAVGDYSGNLTATCSDLNATVALSGTVTAMPIVAAPTFSPDGGTFTEAQAVTISCETEDATIHYTLDGTDPTVSSEVYVSALTIAETTTVKAFAVKDGYQASDIASASYNIVEPQQEKAFTLITSGTALVAGEKYIVVGMANDTYKALGKQNNNNRSAVEVTPVGNTIVTMPAAMPDEEAIFELTLGQDSVGYWTLYDAANQGYLYAASSSSNHLRTQSSNNANGQWTIAIADNGVATIIAQGANTHNTLRYNSSSNNGLFSCYLSGQQDVYLYKAGDAPQPTPQLAVTPTSLSNFDYAYGEGPSSTQTCTVSGNLLTENVTIAAPEHFEISLSAGGTFGNSLVLEPTSGTLEATAVYVRLAAGLSSGSYSGDLTFTSGELNANVALSGSVGTMPVAATPTFSIEGGTYLAPQTVSISTTTPNATIYYTTDGTDPTVSSLVYSSPIEVATTMTIKAMAVAENYINSAIAEATYTITEPLPISGIHNLPNNTYACMEGTVIMIDGRNVYVQDGTAGIDLYLNNNTVPAELALGDLVRAYGKKTVYNGLIELTGINGSNPSEFAILSSGNPLPLEIHTIAEINDDYAGQNLLQSTRVRIENAIIGTINYSGLTVITQGRAQMNIYHLPYVEGLSEGDLVNINGVIGCYNAPQLLVASAADVEFVQGGHLIATPTTLSGLEYSYESGGPSEIVYFELSGTNLLGDAYIYPSEHFEVSTFEQGMFIPEDPAIVTSTTNNFYDIKIYVRMKAGLPVGTYTDQLAITSEGTQSIYVTVIGTVTGDGPTPPPVTGDYVRISSLSQLTNGSHVILAARYDEVANDYVALFNTLSSGKLNTTEFSSTMSGADEIIPASIVSSESDYYWLVDITANGYTFTNANGDVIGYNSSTNFNMNGTKTEWTVATGVSDEGSMVPNYFGFNIINVATDNRAFALNANHVVGAYHIQNMNGADYNFFLDLFVKGEGGTPVVATPTFTPEGGTYFEAQSVSIACATEGATIHYTLDGTDPTESSPVYTVPLTISETTMVKAFAVKEGYDPSAIATATYVIQTGMVTIFNQDWEGEMNGWTFVDVEGEASWTINQHNGNHYAYANGYNHGTNIDWCISPAFNVDDIDNPVLTFRTAKNYTGPDLEVFFSNDYNGTNPLSATWTSLTCALSQGSWNWVESGDIDLSGFSGTNCYIGFMYTCNDSEAAGWEVDDIMLVGQTTTPIITASPLTLSGFSYVVGNGPSTEQSFTVSGMNLTGNLSIHEATNFEISSTSGSGFNAQSTITLTPTNGTVAETTIYVRMKAGLSAGSYDGDIEIVSTGATTVEVTCNGSVIEEPMPGGDYIRIADVSALQDGNKVILAARYNEVTDAYRAMANTLTSGKLATTEFTSLMNGAYEIIPADIVNEEDSYYWTVGVTANGYTFTNANGDVISYGSSGTNFNMNGEKTEWTVSLATAGDGALVPNYTGFNIINVTTDTRAFAVRYYNEDYICGAYATSNMNNGEYNFFLDIFMQGEGGTPTVAAPTFNPAGGTYYATQDVTISCATPDATIYYSLDSDIGPWYEYDEPVTVDESLTLWAYATKVGYNDSPVVSANYIIQGDIVIIFNQDWEEDWHGWTQVNMEGDAEWDIAEHNGNHYAYINGYNLGSNEDWLFSPAFDLDSHSDVVLTFKTAKNYTGPELEVYFSNDYDGQDPTLATWFELPCELSTGGWNWIESGDISLDGFNGSNCYIGFRYTCTEDEAAAWEVDDIMLVAGGGSSASLTATPNAISSLNYIVGNGPSASQSYDLTAANLEGTGSVMVTVTDGFEISLDDEDFGEELEIDYANGQLVGQPVTVYVRLAEDLEIGGYDGTITHIGGGASTTVSLTGTVLSENEPMIEAFMPYYIQGNNGSNNNRVPVAMQVWIYNLEPNTTYRYTNQFVDANDGPETAGAGNVIYVSETGFYRSTSPSLATEGGYGEFTTDIDGNSELLWFMNEPTANARFTPGNQVYLRIRLNDGHDGTTVDRIFTTEDYATVLNFGTEHNANQGSAFYVKSDELPGSFAALYANYEDERPIYSTSVETVGVDYGSINQYANFYKELVAGNDGWFGGILPNDNETGINLIEVWELGSLFPTEYTSTNGQWYPEANTVNPTNGLSEPIFIDLTYDDIDEPVETHIKVWSAYQEFIVENDDADHYSLTVYNVIGQPLLRQQINAGATQRVGHNLPSGLYILNFRNNKNNVSIKLIVR